MTRNRLIVGLLVTCLVGIAISQVYGGRRCRISGLRARVFNRHVQRQYYRSIDDPDICYVYTYKCPDASIHVSYGRHTNDAKAQQIAIDNAKLVCATPTSSPAAGNPKLVECEPDNGNTFEATVSVDIQQSPNPVEETAEHDHPAMAVRDAIGKIVTSGGTITAVRNVEVVQVSIQPTP